VVPIVVTMCVAIRTALWEQVDGVGSTFSMIEGLYIVLCVWLGTTGAGPLSLDGLLARWYAGPAAAAVAQARSLRALA
jgi:hypothetical protein